MLYNTCNWNWNSRCVMVIECVCVYGVWCVGVCGWRNMELGKRNRHESTVTSIIFLVYIRWGRTWKNAETFIKTT